jgi:predicted glycoside hydrolase/deacetylase ChbG (UPF0249 family)
VSTRKAAEANVIVNADDVGQSSGVNRGVIEAFEHGIVTSTRMMVRSPAAAQAARYAREHPNLSVGLHLDLGEWVLREGNWVQLYARADATDPDAVYAELRQQLRAFGDLMGTKPTHIDSHQHVHRREPIRSVAIGLASELGVALRHMTRGIHYCGAFYGHNEHGNRD